MTATYDYNQGIVNFKKFALQQVLIRLSRFYNNNNGNIGSLCVLTFFYNVFPFHLMEFFWMKIGKKSRTEEIDLIE